MSKKESIWHQLTEPFEDNQIKFSLAMPGKPAGPRNPELAYAEVRVYHDRFDAVVGPMNWTNDFRDRPDGKGVQHGIGIDVGNLTAEGASRWVWKWDGAEDTQIEAAKGGISDSFKRAASMWGVGRFLYNYEDYVAKKKYEASTWGPQQIHAMLGSKGFCEERGMEPWDDDKKGLVWGAHLKETLSKQYRVGRVDQDLLNKIIKAGGFYERIIAGGMTPQDLAAFLAAHNASGLLSLSPVDVAELADIVKGLPKG